MKSRRMQDMTFRELGLPQNQSDCNHSLCAQQQHGAHLPSDTDTATPTTSPPRSPNARLRHPPTLNTPFPAAASRHHHVKPNNFPIWSATSWKAGLRDS